MHRPSKWSSRQTSAYVLSSTTAVEVYLPPLTTGHGRQSNRRATLTQTFIWHSSHSFLFQPFSIRGKTVYQSYTIQGYGIKENERRNLVRQYPSLL